MEEIKWTWLELRVDPKTVLQLLAGVCSYSSCTSKQLSSRYFNLNHVQKCVDAYCKLSPSVKFQLLSMYLVISLQFQPPPSTYSSIFITTSASLYRCHIFSKALLLIPPFSPNILHKGLPIPCKQLYNDLSMYCNY